MIMHFISTQQSIKIKRKNNMTVDNKIKYTKCPHCHTTIAQTAQNPNGKCPFRFCKGYRYNNMDTQDSNISNKYNGKSKFSVHLGDALVCIDTIVDEHTTQTNLVCISIGYPVIFILSPEEFNKLC